jgi:hypothetical protein
MHLEINIPRKIHLILAASISLCIGGIAGLEGLFIAAGLIGAIFLIGVSFINKSLFFKFVWWWCVFSGILMDSLGLNGNIVVQYLDKFFLGVLIIHLLMHLRRMTVRDFPILGPTFILVFIAVLSAAINSSPAPALISFLSSYIRIFIFIICAKCLLTDGELKGIISAIFYTGVVQFIIAIIQFSTYGNYNIFVGREIGMIQDAACGTFGYYGAQTLGHLMIILFILSSNLALYTKQKKYLYFAIIYLVTFFLTFTEIDYFFLFGYLLMFFYQKGIKKRYRVAVTALYMIAALIFVNYQINTQGRFYQLLSNKRNIVNSGKVRSLDTMRDLISRDVSKFAVGVGPGTYCSGSAFKHGGVYFRQYVEDRSGIIESTLDYRWSSFMAIVAETGVFSYFVWIFLFGYLFKRGVIFKNQKGQDQYNRGVASAYLSILIFFTYTTFLMNSFEIPSLLFPIAILTAYILKISRAPEAERR